MKAKLFLFGILFSVAVSAQQRFMVIDWDTVTVRTVDKISADMIVNYNYMAHTLPTGLDPELELFVYEGTQAYPPVDYRLYTIQAEYYFLDSLHETWTTSRICGTQYVTEYRDTTELFESISQEENLSNAGVFPYEKQLKYMVMYMGILDRKIDGLNIPPTLQELKPKMDAKIELIYQNYLNSLNKKEAIRDEEAFDIDSGWNNSDPE